MTYEKIERVSAIITNFIYEMSNEEVTNFEFAEAIASIVVSLCEGNMSHEDIFLDLISDMVKSMSLLKPDLYSNNLEVIEMIRDYDLQSLNEDCYHFSNIAFIVQKVFDDDLDVILAFADYLKEFAPEVLKNTFEEE